MLEELFVSMTYLQRIEVRCYKLPGLVPSVCSTGTVVSLQSAFSIGHGGFSVRHDSELFLQRWSPHDSDDFSTSLNVLYELLSQGRSPLATISAHHLMY
jgi:hypothetical protein